MLADRSRNDERWPAGVVSAASTIGATDGKAEGEYRHIPGVRTVIDAEMQRITFGWERRDVVALYFKWAIPRAAKLARDSPQSWMQM